MHDLGIGLGPSAHAYVKEVDAERIGRAEFNATTQTKEARIQERLNKKNEGRSVYCRGNCPLWCWNR